MEDKHHMASVGSSFRKSEKKLIVLRNACPGFNWHLKRRVESLVR